MKWWITILPVMLIAVVLYTKKGDNNLQLKRGNGLVEITFQNYYQDVQHACERYPNIPPSYVLAIIGLECSGRKIIPRRFEKHIYRQLKQVKNGQLKQFERIEQKDLINQNENDLRELSSSWGPMQIMGYKSIPMKINRKDFDKANRVAIGIDWISKNYGTYLREGKFKDAFHIHNTGKPYPKYGKPFTYRKNYVNDGLRLMDSFKNIILQTSN